MINLKSGIVFALLLLILPIGLRADDEADQYFPLGGDFAASHILISHKRADRAKEDVTRSKKEALAKATEIAAKLKANPELFEKLAMEESDGPSARVGGNLKSFKKGKMAPPFENALKKLEDGEITEEPVKTPFGFHIIRRNPLNAKHYCAKAILFTYEGAVKVKGLRDNAPVRSKEEAQKLAEALQGISAADFEKALNEKSDLSSGFMGVFKDGDSPMMTTMVDALKGLKYGEISGVVELPLGFALLQRQKVEKRAASRIWIGYQGSDRPPAGVTRSKADAEKLASELSAKINANPAAFDDLAKEHSDGPFAVRAGLMAPWFKGYQEPAFEDAVTHLKEGEISKQPIETKSGFYIVRKESL